MAEGTTEGIHSAARTSGAVTPSGTVRGSNFIQSAKGGATVRTIIFSILFLVSILCVANSALADDAREERAKIAAAELLELINAKETMLSGSTAMADGMIEANPGLALYRDVLLTWAAKVMTWEEMKPRVIAIYTDAFSERELEELTAFYRTSTGRRSIELAPELIRRAAAIGSELAQVHSGELQQMLDIRSRELQESTSPE